MRNDGGPAFPTEIDASDYSVTLHHGMTMRDYFAAHAPAEYLAVMAEKVQETDRDTEVATIMAAAAFMYADAMLLQREES